MRGAPWNSLCAGALRSDNHGESDHEACARRRPCHPANAPPQAQPEGGGQPKSPTAKQPNSQTAKQPNSQTAKQPNSHTGHCCAWPSLRIARGLRPGGVGRAKRRPVWMSACGFPSGCAEERRFWRMRARVCLSDAKRREFSETPAKLSTAGCPQRSEGTQPVGSLFLGLLSFGEAKESESPAGARPGPRARQRHTTSYKNNSC